MIPLPAVLSGDTTALFVQKYNQAIQQLNQSEQLLHFSIIPDSPQTVDILPVSAADYCYFPRGLFVYADQTVAPGEEAQFSLGFQEDATDLLSPSQWKGTALTMQTFSLKASQKLHTLSQGPLRLQISQSSTETGRLHFLLPIILIHHDE